jgi:hypothetical protein
VRFWAGSCESKPSSESVVFRGTWIGARLVGVLVIFLVVPLFAWMQSAAIEIGLFVVVGSVAAALLLSRRVVIVDRRNSIVSVDHTGIFAGIERWASPMGEIKRWHFSRFGSAALGEGFDLVVETPAGPREVIALGEGDKGRLEQFLAGSPVTG